MTLVLSPILRYLSISIEDPKELWTRLDRTFGKIDEDNNRNLERTYRTIIFHDTKFSSYNIFSEFFQDEKQAKSSSSDFPLNSMQNFRVIASKSEERFDFSPSNVAAGVKICDTLDILE